MLSSGQEPIYSTVRRIGGIGGKQSVSYRPNISVIYLFQGEGKPEEVVRQAVWKTGQEKPTDTANPRRLHQDLADKPGLLTEDSVLKTLASRYHRCQFWVTVSKLPIGSRIQHSISDPHWAGAVESPPPWTPSRHPSSLSPRDIPCVHLPRHWQPADPAGDGRNDKWQVFHHESASLLSCWSWQE